MHLYQPKYRDRHGRERKSRVWWLKAYIEGQKDPLRCSLKTRDKRAAHTKAVEVVRKAERKARGFVDPFEEHRTAPLATHLADFEATFDAKGVTEKHKEDRLGCLRAFIEFAGVETLSGLDGVAADRWIQLLRSSLAARSLNRRIQALRQFGKWLVRARRLDHDPFAALALRNEAADRRYERRALSAEEFSRLLETAALRPLRAAQRQATRKGVPETRATLLRALGASRAFLYLFAAYSGLRNGELRRLRWRDIDESNSRPSILIPARSAKARKEQSVPLHSTLLAGIAAHRERLVTLGECIEDVSAVFPGRVFPRHGTFASDLKAAGIPKRDAAGRVVSFHSLRHTFITNLAVGGVHPRTTQELARHSKIELTMQTYTHLRLVDLHGALESLPEPSVSLPESLPVACLDAASTRTTSHDDGREDGEADRTAEPEDQPLEAVGCGVEDGGSDGTRTRDLRLDRPAL